MSPPIVFPAITVDKTAFAGDMTSGSCPGTSNLEASLGSLVTYCFAITNTGDTLLDDLVVDDITLGIDQSSMTLVSGSTPLEPGVSIVYAVTRVAETTITNTVSVSALPVICQSACIRIPGTTSVTDSDTANVTILGWDVQLTKSGSYSASTATTAWNLTARNNGPGVAPGPMTVTDAVPASMVIVSATGVGWNCSNLDQTLTCVRTEQLEVGQVSAIELVTRNLQSGTFTNSASLAIADDTVLSNNEDSGTVTVRLSTWRETPRTGTEVRPLLSAASGMLIVGWLLLWFRRRREQPKTEPSRRDP